MALELNGTTGVSLVQDGVVTAADLASTLDLTGKTVTLPAGVGGKVLQVVSTNKLDTFSVTASDFVDVTGFSVSITPSSASNKVLVMVHLHIDSEVGGYTNPWRIVRDSTPIAVPTSGGSRRLATGGGTSVYTTGPLQGVHQSAVWLDSPSKTTATTYQIQVATYNNSSGTTYVNRGYSDADDIRQGRYASSIVVMEVAA